MSDMPRLPRFRFRLIPATMLLSVLLLGVKIGDILEGTAHLHRLLSNPAYAAAEKKESETKKEEAKEEKKPEAKKNAADHGKSDGEKKEGEKAEGEKAEGEEHGDKVELPAEPEGPPAEKTEFNQVEIDLLQSLSKRREEIEQWGQEVKLKENTLQATESRIDQKLADLKNLRGQMETLLKQYNAVEDAKIKSLIKIYESMKPKDAARIFDELDMPTLLMVVDKMAEKKAAPILAAMNPIKAKDLTVQLAEQRKTTQPIADSAAAQTAPDAPAAAPAAKK